MKSDRDRDTQPKPRGPTPIGGWLLLAALLGAFSALVAVIAAGNTPEALTKFEHVGAFGDFIGGVLNPLIAAVALGLLWQTYRLQKAELAAAQQALRDQIDVADSQRREQRFFDLLNIYFRTVDSISDVSREGFLDASSYIQLSGKSAISNWLFRGAGQRFETFARTDGAIQKNQDGSTNFSNWEVDHDSEQAISEAWHSPSVAFTFDHYFRAVYRVLKESEQLLGQDHKRYVKLLRAQLTEPELILLTFNMLFDTEGQKMVKFAERHALLKHLASTRLKAFAKTRLPRGVFQDANVSEKA